MSPECPPPRRAAAPDTLDATLRRAADGTDSAAVRLWLLALLERGERAEGEQVPVTPADGERAAK